MAPSTVASSLRLEHDPDLQPRSAPARGSRTRQAEIRLNGVRVPLDHRLVGARTFADTNRVLTKSCQSIACEGLGHAIGASEWALAYAQRREQFGRGIAAFQLVKDMLSHMLTITAGHVTCSVAPGRIGVTPLNY
jgi:alkylation response protein AidB-like acyl-CoA dehydrogenase